MELFLGNCLEVMEKLPRGSIDMVLCDPPYGTTPLKWDSELDFVQLWEQYDRVVKPNGAVILFGQEPFSSALRMSNIKNYRYDWFWEKERLTNVFQVKRRPGKTVENLMVFYREQPTYNPQMRKHLGKRVTNKVGEHARFSETQAGKSVVRPLEYEDDGSRYPTQVLRFPRENPRKRLHPTQKPVALMEYLIRTYTHEGETVLDSCMGSGSTGVACANTNRDFVGVESDEGYFKIAQERLGKVLVKSET